MANKRTMADLPKDWHDEILKIYRDGGYHWDARNWITDNSKFTFNNYYWGRFLNEYEEFREVVERGFDLSCAYWMNQAKEGVKNKSFNSAVFNTVMKNLFNFADQVTTVEVEHSVKEKEFDKMTDKEQMDYINRLTVGAKN